MERRKFLGNVAIGTVGITFLGFPKGFSSDFKGKMPLNDHLYNGFLNPPLSAKPQTWWHWRDGDISKEGITAELEAMKEIGIGGVTMFSVSSYGAKAGPRVICLSPEWHDRVRFATQECDRLGLEFNVHNCAGWSTAGGPWITPDLAMHRVVWSKHSVKSGEALELKGLPSWPEQGDTYYRDIAVLAFPTPQAYQENELPKPKVTCNFNGFDLEKLSLVKESMKDRAELPAELSANKMGWLQFEFPELVTCRSVCIVGSKKLNTPEEHNAIVLASTDGREFNRVCRLSSFLALYNSVDEPMTHAIPETTARFFRLVWDGPVTLGFRQVVWSSLPAIYSYESKIGEQGRTLLNEPVLPNEKDTLIPVSDIVDLAGQLDEKGNLKWSAPATKSQWTVVRIGYRSTGKNNAPAPKEGRGLECDKFNPKAVELHFGNYIGQILKDVKSVNGQSLNGILIDSCETGAQNWSPVFREEFHKRRGYDVLPYLPAFAGFIVETRDVTNRFLRDIRQTCSDLVTNNFYEVMTKLSHQHGLQLHAEACGGSGPGTMIVDGMQHYLHIDVPMTELNRPLKEAVSAAHLQDKKVVALEAFTQNRANWNDSPASIKPIGDATFCAGITRIVFHTYAHNPEVENVFPGPAFGPYGLAFSRGQTWWKMGGAWMEYLSRCQFLLQQGKIASDVLYFYGEDPAGPIPGVLGENRKNMDEWVDLPTGFDFDLLPAEILINDLNFTDGKLVTGNGTSYRLLVLRDSDKMSVEAARKIKELVRSGATVMGPRPKHSLSLNDFPNCDKIIDKIGLEVWGNCDGKTIIRNTYGKGQVFWGSKLGEVLAAMPLLPDFSFEGIPADSDIRFIHRCDGENDIYFISSNQSYSVSFMAGFRVTGKKPEMWDPVTGSIKEVLSFQHKTDQTVLPLRLDSHASVFVIFRRPTSVGAIEKSGGAATELQTKLALDGPWTVKFSSGWGAPESIEFSKLEDWAKRQEKGIRYYSGTAVYSIVFDWAGPVSIPIYLDLGRVAVIAGVRINEADCGIAWTPPYRVDISKALKPGKNKLEIRVANTWLNRLMGDGLGVDMGTTRHTWTTCNPFTVDPEFTMPDISARTYNKDAKPEPVVSGLLGPVKVLMSFD